MVSASVPRGGLRGADRWVRDADLDARFLWGVTMIARPVREQKINYTSNSLQASFERPINRHRESFRTCHFDHPAYRACVAGPAICIVRIVAPLKTPCASATFRHKPGGGSMLVSEG